MEELKEKIRKRLDKLPPEKRPLVLQALKASILAKSPTRREDKEDACPEIETAV